MAIGATTSGGREQAGASTNEDWRQPWLQRVQGYGERLQQMRSSGGAQAQPARTPGIAPDQQEWLGRVGDMESRLEELRQAQALAEEEAQNRGVGDVTERGLRPGSKGEAAAAQSVADQEMLSRKRYKGKKKAAIGPKEVTISPQDAQDAAWLELGPGPEQVPGVPAIGTKQATNIPEHRPPANFGKPGAPLPNPVAEAGRFIKSLFDPLSDEEKKAMRKDQNAVYNYEGLVVGEDGIVRNELGAPIQPMYPMGIPVAMHELPGTYIGHSTIPSFGPGEPETERQTRAAIVFQLTNLRDEFAEKIRKGEKLDIGNVIESMDRRALEFLPFSPEKMARMFRINELSKRHKEWAEYERAMSDYQAAKAMGGGKAAFNPEVGAPQPIRPTKPDGAQLTEEEMLTMETFFMEKHIRKEIGTTMAGEWAEGIVQILPYAMEIYATGGAAAGFRKASSATVRKAVERTLGKRLAAGLVGKGLRGAGMLTTEMAIGAARTLLDPADLTAETVERMLPDYDFTELDRKQLAMVMSAEGQDAPLAFRNTFLDRWFEYTSEEMGIYLAKLGAPVRRRVMKGLLIRSWLAANPEKRIPDFISLLNRGGIQGFPEEMGEEQLGRMMRAIFEVDFTDEEKQQMVQVGPIAVPYKVRRMFHMSWRELGLEAAILGTVAGPGAVSRVQYEHKARARLMTLMRERSDTPLEERRVKRAASLLVRGSLDPKQWEKNRERAASIAAGLKDPQQRDALLRLAARRPAEPGAAPLTHQELDPMIHERINELVEKEERGEELTALEAYERDFLLANRRNYDNVADLWDLNIDTERMAQIDRDAELAQEAAAEQARQQQEVERQREVTESARREAEATEQRAAELEAKAEKITKVHRRQKQEEKREERKQQKAALLVPGAEGQDANSPGALEYLARQLQTEPSDIAKMPKAERQRLLDNPQELAAESVRRRANRELKARLDMQERAEAEKAEKDAKAQARREKAEREETERQEREAQARDREERQGKAKTRVRDLVASAGAERGRVSLPWLKRALKDEGTDVSDGVDLQEELETLVSEGVLEPRSADGTYHLPGGEAWAEEERRGKKTAFLGGRMAGDGRIVAGSADATVSENDLEMFEVKDKKGNVLAEVPDEAMARSIAEKILGSENRDKPMADRVAELSEEEMGYLQADAAMKVGQEAKLTDFEQAVAERAGLLESTEPEITVGEPEPIVAGEPIGTAEHPQHGRVLVMREVNDDQIEIATPLQSDPSKPSGNAEVVMRRDMESIDITVPTVTHAPVSTMRDEMRPLLQEAVDRGEISEAEFARMQAADSLEPSPQSGEPFRADLYHASGRSDQASIYAEGADGAALGPGRYSAPSEAAAAGFGPDVEQIRVSLENPYVLSNNAQLRELMGANIPEENAARVPLLQKARAELERRGHDGVIVLLPRGDMDATGESNKRLREIFAETQVVEFADASEGRQGVTPGRSKKQKQTAAALNEPTNPALAAFRSEFPLIRRPSRDDAVWEEVAHPEKGALPQSRMRNDPNLPGWDEVLEAAKERNLVDQDAGPEALLILYRGRIPTVAQQEAARNRQAEHEEEEDVYRNFLADVIAGILPPKAERERFPEAFESALVVAGVDEATLLPDAQSAEADRGTVQEPAIPPLVHALRERITQAVRAGERMTNPNLKAFIAEWFDTDVATMVDDDSYSHKKIQEAYEAALTQVAANIVLEHANDPDAALALLMELNANQVTLAERTSRSMMAQAYSTPAPYAYLAGRYAGIMDADSVLDTSAGHGMLEIAAGPDADLFLNEPDEQRRETLITLTGYTAISGYDAIIESKHPGLGGSRVDTVMANPPFGQTDTKGFHGYKLSKKEHIIIARSLAQMKDDGRAALIIGGTHPAQQGKTEAPANADRVFFNWLYHHYNVVRNFDVEGSVYRKMGTSYPTRLLVVDGRKATPDGIAPFDTISNEHNVSLEDIDDAYWEDVLEGRLNIKEGGTESELVRARRDEISTEFPGGEPASQGPAERSEGGASVREEGAPSSAEGEAGPGGLDTTPGSTERAGAGDVVEPGGQRREPGSAGAAGEREAGGVPETGERGGGVPAGEAGAAASGGPGAVGGRGPDGGTQRPGEGQPAAPPADRGVRGAAEEPGDERRRIAEELGIDPALLDEMDNVMHEGQAEEEPPESTRLGMTIGVPTAEMLAKLAKIGPMLATTGKKPKFDDWTTAIWKLYGEEYGEALLANLPPAYIATLRAVDAETRARMDSARFVADQTPAKIKAMLASGVAQNEAVAADRRRAEEARAKREAAEREKQRIQDEAERLEREGMSMKVPYETRSQVEKAGTLIPKNLVQHVTDALDRIEKKNGNIDKWVAGELGMTTEELGKAFYAEQVDAIALAFDQNDGGQALIIGDETGTGKGRTAVALMLRAMKQGYKPIFVTEKDDLFTDIYRDFIEVLDAAPSVRAWLGKDIPVPFILNDGISVMDPRTSGTDVLFKATSAATKREFNRTYDLGLESPVMADADLILMTYSQIQSPLSTRKRAFLASASAGNTAIMDEAHSAAGTNTRRVAVFGAIQTAQDSLASPLDAVNYLSATFAKRPDTMALYIRTILGRVPMSKDALVSILQSGGVPLQEWIAEQLAVAGQYIRRERDFTDVTFGQITGYDDLPPEQQEEKRKELQEGVDAVTMRLRRIWQFSEALAPVIAAIKKNILTQIGGSMTKPEKEAFRLRTTGFDSIAHNYVNQYMLSARIESVVRETLKNLKRDANGRPTQKVVVTVMNTMERIIGNLGFKRGDAVPDNYLVSMKRALRTILRYKYDDAQGQEHEGYVTPADMQEAGQDSLAAELKAITEDLEAGDEKINLPLSPIDALRDALEAEGLTVAEGTGRQLKVVNGIFEQRTAAERVTRSIIDQFNRGEVDVIIGNRTISTGISLHAHRDFKDTRRRVMIAAQADYDVNVQIQLFGRVNRWGQVVTPELYVLTSHLPAEIRPVAILMRKMHSLNANTTAKGEGQYDVDVDDMMNRYGDEIVYDYFTDHPEIGTQIMLRYETNDEGQLVPARKKEDFAKWSTGRMALLPTETQEAVYNEVIQRYREKIEELNLKGENDLVSTHMDLQAEEMDRFVQEPATDDSNGLTDGVYVGTYRVKNPERGIDRDHIRALRDRNAGSIQKVINLIREKGFAWARERDMATHGDRMAPGDHADSVRYPLTEHEANRFAKLVRDRKETIRKARKAAHKLRLDASNAFDAEMAKLKDPATLNGKQLADQERKKVALEIERAKKMADATAQFDKANEAAYADYYAARNALHQETGARHSDRSGWIGAKLLHGMHLTIGKLRAMEVGRAYEWYGAMGGVVDWHQHNILVNVTVDENAVNPGAESNVTLHFVQPGRGGIARVPLSRVQQVNALMEGELTETVEERANRAATTLLSAWDRMRGEEYVERQIVTGNLVMGYQFITDNQELRFHPKIITFTMKNGRVVRGILIPDTHAVTASNDVKVGTELLNQLLDREAIGQFRIGPAIVTLDKGQDSTLTIMQGRANTKYVTDEALVGLLSEGEGFRKRDTDWMAHVSEANTGALVEYLASKFGMFQVRRADIPDDLLGETNEDNAHDPVGKIIALPKAAMPDQLKPLQSTRVLLGNTEAGQLAVEKIGPSAPSTARLALRRDVTFTHGGKQITAELLAEDADSITVKPEDGAVIRYQKSQIKRMERTATPLETTMDARQASDSLHVFRLELPELIHLVKQLLGENPRILRKLRAKRGTTTYGSFLAHPDPDKAEMKILARLAADPDLAAEVVAHEIGHMLDWLPDYNIKRGNILGRIASFLKYSLSELPEFYGEDLEHSKVIDKKTQDRLRAEARKEAKTTLGEGATEAQIKLAASQLYQEKIRDFASERHIWTDRMIRDELKAWTVAWDPFDPATASKKYLEYRYSSVELYADAMSGFLNAPEVLQERAPMFYQAMMNWIDSKPEVRDLWQEIQHDISSGAIFQLRIDRVYDMIERGEERLAAARAARRDNVAEVFKQGLFSRTRPLELILKTKRKAGVDWDPQTDPLLELERYSYTVSAIHGYLEDTQARVLDVLKKNHMTTRDLAVYLFLNRTATERANLFNPQGLGNKSGEKTIEEMKTRLGSGAVSILEQLREDYFNTRTEHVIMPIAMAGMYNAELMAKIQDNDNYVTFNVQKYINEKFPEATGYIFPQHGTFEDITDPFGATLAKDLVLLRVAYLTVAKKKMISWMETNAPELVKPAETSFNGRANVPIESKKYNEKLITVMDRGKVKGYYVPKDVAELYESDPILFQPVFSALMKLTAPFKSMFTAKNPWWIFWNVQRDAIAAAKQLPGASLTKITWYMIRSMKDAAMDVFAGKSTPIVREMLKGRMLLVGFGRTISESENPADEAERMMLKYQIKNFQGRRGVKGWVHAVWDSLDKPGQFFERLVKIAGYKYLLEKYPNMSEARMAHLVITRAGSPNFKDGGRWRQAYNNIFLFSNAQLMGWKASIEAMGDQPVAGVSWLGYALKTVKYTIMPKVLMIALAKGWLFGGEDDEQGEMWDWLRRVKQMYAKIPSWDKARRLCIPLHETEAGECVYVVLPFDFTGEWLSALLWFSADNVPKGDVTDAIAYAQSEHPYGGRNPALSFIGELMEFIAGESPRDKFRGRDVIPDAVMKMGHPALNRHGWRLYMKHVWNNMGPGSIFGTFDPEGVTPLRSGALRYASTTPFLGRGLSRFLRVSNRGEQEIIENDPKMVALGQADSKKSYEQSRIILDSIYKWKKEPSTAAMERAIGLAWKEVKNRDLQRDTDTAGRFRRRYINNFKTRFGTAEERTEKRATPSQKQYLRDKQRYQR